MQEKIYYFNMCVFFGSGGYVGYKMSKKNEYSKQNWVMDMYVEHDYIDLRQTGLFYLSSRLDIDSTLRASSIK